MRSGATSMAIFAKRQIIVFIYTVTVIFPPEYTLFNQEDKHNSGQIY
jgi:hypothetical protein